MTPRPTFIIRNNPSFVKYVKRVWHYFTSNKREGCKITIRKSNVFIHIDKFYCVIFNDLKYIDNHPEKYKFEMNAKARELLALYNYS